MNIRVANFIQIFTQYWPAEFNYLSGWNYLGSSFGFRHNISTADRVFFINQKLHKNVSKIGQYIRGLWASRKSVIQLGGSVVQKCQGIRKKRR
jgi:hypothetical protein